MISNVQAAVAALALAAHISGGIQPGNGAAHPLSLCDSPLEKGVVVRNVWICADW